MSEKSAAAAGSGAAHDVTAVTGPPLPDHLALAAALKEATIADGIVERMRRKVAKAQTISASIVSEAQDALAAAEADAQAADDRVAELAGGDAGPAALASMKAAAEQAMAEYESAAERLGGEG